MELAATAAAAPFLTDDQANRLKAARDYAALVTTLFEAQGAARPDDHHPPDDSQGGANGEPSDRRADSRDRREPSRGREKQPLAEPVPPQPARAVAIAALPVPVPLAVAVPVAERAPSVALSIAVPLPLPLPRRPVPQQRVPALAQSRGPQPPPEPQSQSQPESEPQPQPHSVSRKPAALVTPVINRTINRIYTGNISTAATEATIRGLFSKVGFIKELSMTRDPDLNTHKGWCFLEYDAPEAAAAAVRLLDGAELDGRNIKVKYTNAYTDDIWRHFPPRFPTRVYFANVHDLLAEDEMRELFAPFGTITQFSLCPDTTTFRHKSYGYVEYETALAANRAVQTLDQVEIGGERLLVTPTLVGGPFPEGMQGLSRFPRPRVVPPPLYPGPRPALPKFEAEAPSPVLLLCNMVQPHEVDEDLKVDVEEECARHGAVQLLVVHVNTALPNETGVRVFVKFASVAEREACQGVMHGRFFGGNRVTATEYSLDRFEARDYDA
ncbi:hypothetical protein H9P43_005318 [Blastocladiella emersonii ATCC 22665]|nr:hypothetical protein H9P43_005289 [Blastocladiella emersonii ATCC 22665]KAI9179986.1 hypothetical protein H9P43_005318 [Blastocladiella emersonii ATCC 22665]